MEDASPSTVFIVDRAGAWPAGTVTRYSRGIPRCGSREGLLRFPDIVRSHILAVLLGPGGIYWLRREVPGVADRRQGL